MNSRIFSRKTSGLAFAALVFASGAAQAAGTSFGTLTSNFAVGAACAVSSNFGTYGSGGTIPAVVVDLGTAPQTNTNALADFSGGSIFYYTVACGNGVSYTVTFGQGNNFDAFSSGVRNLRNVAGSGSSADQFIAYDLFKDDNATPVPSNGEAAITVNSVGTPVTSAFYSRVTDSRTPDVMFPGSYTDVVQVSLSYTP